MDCPETALACFNPRAPYGARRRLRSGLRLWGRFQSTRPVRGATFWTRAMIQSSLFQSTRPVRGATRGRPAVCKRPNSFNPRAPYGARPSPSPPLPSLTGFQSTRPVRGATLAGDGVAERVAVSIHAPRTGRDGSHSSWPAGYAVSIHAPRTGRDGYRREPTWAAPRFQSTRPVRGATLTYAELTGKGEASIHAPRTGRDRGIRRSRFLW